MKKAIDKGVAEKESSILAAIVQSSDDAIFSKSLDGTITSWNPAAEKMFGYKATEVVGKPVTIIFPAERLGELQKIIDKVKKGIPVERYETQRKHKDGRVIDVSVTVSPMRDTEGNIVGLSAIDRDITGLRRVEKERSILAAIVQSSSDAFVGMSPDGTIISWSPGSEKMFGYSASEAIGKSGKIIYPPQRTEELAQNIEKIKKGEQIRAYETERKRKDGSLIPVAVSASPIKDEKGEIIGIAVIDRDITGERRTAQYARSLIEASLDPLVTISPEGKITDVNEATIKVTGIQRQNLIGTDFSDYFTEPEKAREGYQRVLKKWQVRDYPLTIKGKEGALIDVLYNATVYKDESGNILGVFAAARDITETKRASQYARSLIEASLDPLVTISPEGKITDVNEATIKATGIQREKLIGTDFSDYFTEPEKARDGYRQVFEKGFVTDYALTIKHKDGKETDVLYNASVYKDDKGNVLGVFAAARDITQTKQSTAYARSLIEASLDPLVTISPDGKITDVNEATVQVTGYTREKLIGSDFSSYFTDPEEARQGYQQVFKQGFVRDYPLTIRHISGNLTDVLYNATVYKDEKGSVRGVFAAARDVTARKKAEEQLHETSAYARSLIEASLDPLFAISPDGKITDVNNSAGEATGVSKEWLIGTDFSSYFTEPRKARDGYRLVLKEGSVRNYPLTLRNASGQIRDVLFNASVYKDAAGKVRGVFAAARDVTETKQASQYARSLIEASLDPLVTISPEGKITDVNEATIRITGITREKLIGTDFSNYFTDPQKARAGYEQVFRKGFVTDYPLTIRSTDNKLTDVLYNATVYKDEKANVLGVFAAARDITQRKTVDEMKTEFVSLASHQLNTPLTAISGFSEELLDGIAGPLNKEQESFVREIYEVSKRMTELINALLNVSRIELGIFAIEPQPTDVAKNAESVLGELAAKIEEKKLRLEKYFDPNIPTMNVDPKLIRIIFQNLLSNAVKYTPLEGTIKLSIEKREPNVLITVADTGYGIPEEAQSKVFTKLFRADNIREKEPYGTGLGLYIVKSIIETTAGKIWFESEENKGTTFFVTLPLAGMKKQEGTKGLQ